MEICFICFRMLHCSNLLLKKIYSMCPLFLLPIIPFRCLLHVHFSYHYLLAHYPLLDNQIWTLSHKHNHLHKLQPRQFLFRRQSMKCLKWQFINCGWYVTARPIVPLFKLSDNGIWVWAIRLVIWICSTSAMIHSGHHTCSSICWLWKLLRRSGCPAMSSLRLPMWTTRLRVWRAHSQPSPASRRRLPHSRWRSAFRPLSSPSTGISSCACFSSATLCRSSRTSTRTRMCASSSPSPARSSRIRSSPLSPPMAVSSVPRVRCRRTWTRTQTRTWPPSLPHPTTACLQYVARPEGSASRSAGRAAFTLSTWRSSTASSFRREQSLRAVCAWEACKVLLLKPSSICVHVRLVCSGRPRARWEQHDHSVDAARPRVGTRMRWLSSS